LKSTGQTYGQLLVDNNNSAGAVTPINETITFDNLTVQNKAKLSITTGTTITTPTAMVSGGGLNIESSAVLDVLSLALESSSTLVVGLGSNLSPTDLVMSSSTITNNGSLTWSTVTFTGADTITNNGEFTVSHLTVVNLTLYQKGSLNIADNSLTIDTNGVFVLDVPLEMGSVTINSGGTLTHSAGQAGLNVTVTGNLTVGAGGSISVDGKGYDPGSGPGAGGSSCGGGYGGAGGGQAGGSTYGSITAPSELGSGGGGSYYAAGGAGGGAIRLTVNGTLTVNGGLTANGNDGVHYGGGGSGGSIWVIANELTGTGLTSANGGNSGGGGAGGGGGGRIAVYYRTSTFSGSVGANGGTGRANGKDGTVLMTVPGSPGESPATVSALSETTFMESTLIETLLRRKATLNNAVVTGDLNGTLDFTNFEMVSIQTGSFAGKGFSTGEWHANLEGISYAGNWEGFAFLDVSEKKIYLKGAISGGISGIAEGYLTESTPGSGVYNQYQATWKLGRLGSETVSGTINLAGDIAYQESYEYPSTELYVLQSSIEGTTFGYYAGPLSTVLTHLSVADGNNPYDGQGFSIISYTSESGSGEGFTYDKLVSPGRVELKGLFTSPLLGILSATLDESKIPRTLFMVIERIDLGLPPAADLKVTTWGPGRVSPGQTVSYVVEYRNDGLKAADEAIVFNCLDPQVEYMAGSEGAYSNNILHYTTWDLGSVPAKTNGYLGIQARVLWGLPMGTELKNAAYIVEIVPHSSEENLCLNGIAAVMERDPMTGEYEDGGTKKWVAFCKENNAKPEWLYTHENANLAWPIGGLQDVLEVYLASPYNPIGVPMFTQRNGGNVPPGYHPKVLAFSGGTRSAISLIERYIETEGREGIMTGDLILISPMLTSSEELRILKQKGIKITIYQSPKDDIVPNQLTEGTLSYTDPEGRKLTVQVNGNVAGNLVKIKWEKDGNVIYEKDFHIQGDNSNNGDLFQSEEGIVVEELDGRHGGLIPELNNQGQEGKSSSSSSTVAVARDPNIKYGPEGNVSPGQKLDYIVKYENEGEGIAFGVYITDVLDEDLSDATLVINNGGIYNPPTRTITWFIGQLDPHQGGSVGLSANIRSDAPEGTDVINYATVYFPSVPEITRTNGVVSIIPLPNRPPIANAGPDQTVECTSPDGARVTLDGTGSSDPDNDPLTFTWRENGNIIAGPTTDPISTVTLAPGTHTIQLTIDDGQGETGTDQVVIYVVGAICGDVTHDNGNPVANVTVKVIDSDNNQVGDPIVTGSDGTFYFDSLLIGTYSVMIVTPLGYSVSPGETQTGIEVTGYPCTEVNFVLTPTITSNDCRTIGYWKHQFDVYLSGRGSAQEDSTELEDYLDLVHLHFDVLGIYTDLENFDFVDAKNVLTVSGGRLMLDRAKQQLFALLLNFASGKIGNETVVSADGRVAAEAVTYAAILISDGDPENDELAKTICDLINNRQMVETGIIPESPIRYRATEHVGIPKEYTLNQNYPNPFNPITQIRYAIPTACQVRLEIYNLLGQKVTVLVDEYQQAGQKTVNWEAKDLSSGIYFYKLNAGNFTATKKMVLTK